MNRLLNVTSLEGKKAAFAVDTIFGIEPSEDGTCTLIYFKDSHKNIFVTDEKFDSILAKIDPIEDK